MAGQKHVILAVLGVFVAGLSACSVPVAGSLDERDANVVADVLARSGLDSSKEADPEAEGRYRVLVPRDESPRAIATLHDHDLPPRHAPGVVDSIGKGSLVPSALAEHAQYVAGLAGDLERTIATVDGVLGARVHLSVPPKNPFLDAPTEKPTASILIKHRGSTPPIGEHDVRRLVAGSVTNLQPDAVTVVMVGRAPGSELPGPTLAHFGPIALTRASLLWVRILSAALSASLLGLLGLILYQRGKLKTLQNTNQEGRA